MDSQGAKPKQARKRPPRPLPQPTSIGSSPAPNSDVPVTLGGGFASIFGLTFEGQKLKHGRDIVKNLCSIYEKHMPGEEHFTISAKMLRTTSVAEEPYSVKFNLEKKTRKVIMASCSCPVGKGLPDTAMGACKHVAAL